MRGQLKAASRLRRTEPRSSLRAGPPAAALPEAFRAWFAARGWQPREHQLRLLDQVAARRSTLLIAPTGSGKTLAGFLPSLIGLSQQRRPRGSGIHTLYVSPLKALAADVARNLVAPVEEMGSADPRRDPQRRYLDRPQGAPARQPARHAAHHARADHAAAVAPGRRLPLPRPRHGGPRRAACAGADQARRPAGARSRPPRNNCPRIRCAWACRRPWPARASSPPIWCRSLVPGPPTWRTSSRSAAAHRTTSACWRRRPSCRGPATAHATRFLKSMQPSRPTSCRWCSSIRAARRSCCSRSCGASTTTPCPSPCTTARSTPPAAARWRRPWPPAR